MPLGRSPCGERGLKSCPAALAKAPVKSLPVRGAWIVIYCKGGYGVKRRRSLPVRGAWIEILRCWLAHDVTHASLPVRGAWIEIDSPASSLYQRRVAPRAGSVD